MTRADLMQKLARAPCAHAIIADRRPVTERASSRLGSGNYFGSHHPHCEFSPFSRIFSKIQRSDLDSGLIESENDY
jgi:hypothetical protein